MTDDRSDPWVAVSAAFGALGFAFLCLDGDLRVLHSSPVLDELLGPGAASGAEGCSAEDLLGSRLFGPTAPLRRALLAGERREGLRAILKSGRGAERPVTVTAAPIPPPAPTGDSRGAFLLVLRAAEAEPTISERAVLFAGESPSESERLRFALAEHRWRRSETARALGVSRTTLWRMMREAGIEA